MLKSLMKITYIFIAVLLMLSSCTNWKGDNGGGNNNNTPTPVCVPPVNVIYVKWDATGNNDGTSWKDAFVSLQSGLEAAVSGKQIWVARGIYNPSVEVGGSGERYKAFQMKNGVTIYGGFTGIECNLSQRDIIANETILSGDIGTVGDNSDNVYHIFVHQIGLGLDGTAVLDGFTLTGGYADGAPPNNLGGAIANGQNSPTITNCKFTDNYAANRGAAIFNTGSSPTITNCTFINNITLNVGSGIANFASSSPSITNCTFTSNTAAYGAIYNDPGSSPTITISTFTNNTATIGGGAIHTDGGAPVITNCTFTSNTATGFWGGGAIINDDSNASVITNCTFTSNSATISSGGAIANHSSSTPTITGCTFDSNSAATNGGAIYSDGTSAPIITGPTFSGNTPDDIFP